MFTTWRGSSSIQAPAWPMSASSQTRELVEMRACLLDLKGNIDFKARVSSSFISAITVSFMTSVRNSRHDVPTIDPVIRQFSEFDHRSFDCDYPKVPHSSGR